MSVLHRWILLLCAGRFLTAFAKCQVTGRVARGSLPGGMQRFQKCNERRSLRWTQVFPIRRHVAAALNHLPDELVLCQSNGDSVQGRAPLSTGFAKRVAVAALLHLKH